MSERQARRGTPSRGVLMVVGAYFPELSGAGLQCRTLVGRLRGEVDFMVLTTTAHRSSPTESLDQGVPVYRVFVDPTSALSKLRGLVLFTRLFLRLSPRFSLVHLHGFSQKSVLMVVLGRLTGKKIAVKLTSFGDDDPASIGRRSRLAAWCYRRADRFFAVSPRFRDSYDAAGLDPQRFRVIANGVDLERFRPVAAEERRQLRALVGLPPSAFVVLFVGFFSREKQPDLMFDAWADLACHSHPETVLVFIGATQSAYHEVDARLADGIRERAGGLGLLERLRFIESTHEIERFQRAADAFAMPSLREGMPNALLEAMACGTACLVSRIEGITDRIIDHDRNGLLLPAEDRAAWTAALRTLAESPAHRARLGGEARSTAEARFGLERTARAYLDEYDQLLGRITCAA